MSSNTDREFYPDDILVTDYIPLTQKVKEAAKDKLITYRVGQYKLKDKEGRNIITINNKAEKYMVVKEIMIRKVPGETNKFEVMLLLPDPHTVDVVEKSTP